MAEGRPLETVDGLSYRNRDGKIVHNKERELIQAFGGSYSSPPPILSKFQQGLFAKVRDRFLSF